ncbi:hypothetical protein BC936DRAFT_137309 [Jimgerdemannia flammicorona]|uniref:Fungal-type protein kinase domain-containing protein n=1 Tax=Jimgerdemannia flammicorona TaxID=994334 RepID=A0A433CXP0_9FUNG|nr:hypothetical protein BC936DRAFT_137309 [Jimgerdemannia flammicorona]
MGKIAKPTIIEGQDLSGKATDMRIREWDETLIQLTSYVREVFSAQVTCELVIEIILCGNSMHVWQFERAGGIGNSEIRRAFSWSSSTSGGGSGGVSSSSRGCLEVDAHA